MGRTSDNLESSITITRDSTPPTAPVFNRTDFTVNTASFDIEGTTEAGTTVSLTVGSVSVDVLVEVADWSATVTLSEGENTFIATAFDGLHRSLESSLTVTLDTVIPIAPVFTTTDSTTVNTASFDIKGTAESGTTVSVIGRSVTVDALVIGTDWTATVILFDGVNTITATASDGANTSIESSLTVTLDISIATAPVITIPSQTTIAEDTITITGTGDAGATITLTVDGTVLPTTAIVAIDESWSIANVALTEGENIITATAIDSFVRPSGISNTLIIIHDINALAAPVITIPAQTTIDENTITVTGTGDAGATITLTVGGTEFPTIATVAIDESWSIANVALTEGENIITATASDSLGRTSGNSTTLTITRDSTPPNAPVITTTDSTTVNTASFNIEGTTEDGTTVSLTVGSVSVDALVVGTDWTATVTLSEGENTITATATDSLGRPSGNSNTLTIILDTIPPTFSARTTSTSQITITFSESVTGTTAAADWSVIGNVVSSVSQTDLSGGVTLIELTLQTELDTDATPSVIYTAPQTNPITDGLNSILPMPVTSTDGIRPTFTAEFTSPIDVLITFSEPVSGETGIGSWFFSEVNDIDIIISRTIPSSVSNSDLLEQREITLVFSPALNPDFNDYFNYSGGLEDLFGNQFGNDGNGTPSNFSTGISNVHHSALATDTIPPIIAVDPTEIILARNIIVPDLLEGVTSDVGSIIRITGTVDRNTVGDYVISYDTTDNAGNDADQIRRTYSVTAPPTAPVITIPAQTTIAEDTITITGTGDAGTTITLTVGGTVLSTIAPVETDGSWTIANVALNEGENIITAVTIDSFGRLSGQSNTLTIILDTIPPTFSARTTSTSQITITFSESVTGTTAAADWSVIGNVVSSVSQTDLSGGVTLIELTLQTELDTDATPSVIYTAPQTNPITDGLNSILPMPVTSTDGIRPTFTAEFTSPIDVLITFSEPVSGETGIGSWFFSELRVGTNIFSAPSSVSNSDLLEQREITLVFSPALNPDSNDVFNYSGGLEDLSGNQFGNLGAKLDDFTTGIDNVHDSALATDTIPPIITVDPTEIILALDSTVPDLLEGVTSDVGSIIRITGTVDINTIDDYVISYDTTDNAGNDADQIRRTYSVTAPPTAPVITIPAQTTIAEDTITITGTGDAGTTITLTVGGTVLSTIAPVETDGSWTIANVPLNEGPNIITATATDSLNRTSGNSTTLTIIHDINALAAPVITNPSRITIAEDTITITGTGDAGTTITLFVDGTVLPSIAPVETDGSWTIANVPLNEGPNIITAAATDSLNRTSGNSNTLTITRDSTSPTTPIITNPSRITIAEDTITITGTGDAGATITLTVTGFLLPDILTTTVTVAIDGSWSIVNVPLNEGLNTITATATDSLGRTSGNSNDLFITRDSTPPIAPLFTTTDSTVNTASFNIEGTTEDRTTVSVTVGSASPVSATLSDIDDTWSATVTLSEGENIITATATDSLGRTSGNSNDLFITRDSTPPIAPLFTTTDSTVNTASFDIEGTTEAGTTVSVTVGSASPVSATLSDIDDTWSATVTLSEGPNTITATASDGLNTSIESSLTVTLDTVAPIAPVFTTTNSTTVDTASFDVEGTTEVGTTVSVTVGSVSVDALVTVRDWTATVTLSEGENTFTATASDGLNTSPPATITIIRDSTPPTAPVFTTTNSTTVNTASFDIEGTTEFLTTVSVTVGSVSVDALVTFRDWTATVTLSEGPNTITATASDGPNTSIESSLTVTLDTVAPIAPVFTTTNSTTVNTASFDIEGTTEAGTTVSVTGRTVSVDALVMGTDWTATVTLSEGSNNIFAIASDGPNTSGAFNLIVILDTSIATAPVITIPSQTTIAEDTITIIGTGDAGATITLTVGGTVLPTMATVAIDESWSIANVALNEGENIITATAIDSLNRTSGNSNTLTIIHDISALAAPVITTPAQTTIAEDTITITGTGDAGATITLTVDGTVLPTTATVAIDESWSIANVLLNEGANIITATATDSLNRTSGNSNTLTIIHDISALAAPVITTPAQTTIAEDTITITGTGDAGATITLTVDGTELTTIATVETDGSWTIANVPLNEGLNIITAAATDSLNRTSGNSNTLTITRDSTPPNAPVITTPDSTTVNTASFNIEGTTEDRTTVSVTVGSVSVDALVVGTDWTATVTLSDGENIITATASDGSGNESVPSNILIITLDTAPPTISGARTATTSTITITFNENVFGNTSNSDWSVAGNTITSISQTDLSEGTGSLILTVITALDTDATPSVTYTAPPTDPITDNARHSLASATIISTDGIAPTFTAKTGDSGLITVSFTEPILPPPSSPNTWSVSGTSLTSTNISSLSGDLLHSGLNSGATPTITYLPPFEDPITDLSGNVLDTTPIIAEDGVIPAPSQIFRASDTMAYIVFQEDIHNMGTAYVQLTLGAVPPPFVPTLTIVSIDGSRILASGIDSTLLSSNMLDVFFNNITDSSGNIRSNMTHNIVQAFPSIPVNNSPAFTTTEFTIPTGVTTEHTITAPTDNDELTLTITPTGTDHIIPTKFTITSSDVTLIIPEDTTYTVQNNPSNSNELVIDPTIDRQSVTYIAFDNADANIKNANDAIVALLDDSSHQPLYLVEIGSTTQTATLDKPVSIRLAGASNADYIYYIETSQTSDRTVHSIIQCTDDAITAIVPPTFSGQDECYIIDGADIVIWTNHFTQFGASTMRTAGTSSSSSSSSGCNDCTPPTLGVDNTGTRRVSNGFTYNEQTTNVDYYYTPLPLITVEVGQENVAKLRIYEDSGPTRLRHAGLAFGISTGQHFAQSEVSINVDISFNGELAINLNDPQNIIDNDTLRAERTIVSCMENSESECTLITINHTFRQPLDFNIVSTSVWDERRNSWQNFYNHGIEITGDSLNPTHGILVNDGTLTLYPIIEGTVDKDGDSIYDTRHVIYMLDDGGILYRLGTDDTYQIVRNLYSQLHDVDDSMYNDDRIGSHGVERDQDAFIVELEKQDVIAHKIIDSMNMRTDKEIKSTLSPYENIKIIPRIEKLDDIIEHEIDAAEQLARKLHPLLYAE